MNASCTLVALAHTHMTTAAALVTLGLAFTAPASRLAPPRVSSARMMCAPRSCLRRRRLSSPTAALTTCLSRSRCSPATFWRRGRPDRPRQRTPPALAAAAAAHSPLAAVGGSRRRLRRPPRPLPAPPSACSRRPRRRRRARSPATRCVGETGDSVMLRRPYRSLPLIARHEGPESSRGAFATVRVVLVQRVPALDT